jgi:hypothetical protein
MVKNGCMVLSGKFFMIHTINSLEIFGQCGSGHGEKIPNYIFGSENKIIIIGLKGSGSVFINNLDEFRNSLRTLKINQPLDINEIVNNDSRS